jgi:hypothetical protein
MDREELNQLVVKMLISVFKWGIIIAIASIIFTILSIWFIDTHIDKIIMCGDNITYIKK